MSGQAQTPGGQWKIQNPQGMPSCLFKDGNDPALSSLIRKAIANNKDLARQLLGEHTRARRRVLDLLVLVVQQDILQLRIGLFLEGLNAVYFLNVRKRIVVSDCYYLSSFIGKNGRYLGTLLRRHT